MSADPSCVSTAPGPSSSAGRNGVAPHRAAVLVIAVMLTALLCGCAPTTPGASAGTRPAVPTVPGSVPRPDHVVVVVFENKNYEQVIGNPAAPFLTQMATTGANLTDAHGETHPSQPNYVALLSGSTHGVTNDACPQDLGGGATLATQLLAAGDSFTGFSEALPTPGYLGCDSPDRRYARKHNPWADFSSTPPAANAPLSQWPRDYSQLPTVSIVIPDLCDDMHDCPVSRGDTWAHDEFTPYLAWARSHNSLLMVTFDEDDGTPANHIPTVLVGPMVRATDVSTHTDHYTLLRTLEDMYGLPPLDGAASAPPLTGIWTR